MIAFIGCENILFAVFHAADERFDIIIYDHGNFFLKVFNGPDIRKPVLFPVFRVFVVIQDPHQQCGIGFRTMLKFPEDLFISSFSVFRILQIRLIDCIFIDHFLSFTVSRMSRYFVVLNVSALHMPGVCFRHKPQIFYYY